MLLANSFCRQTREFKPQGLMARGNNEQINIYNPEVMNILVYD